MTKMTKTNEKDTELDAMTVTAKQLRRLPYREYNNGMEFSSLIVLPARINWLKLAWAGIRNSIVKILFKINTRIDVANLWQSLPEPDLRKAGLHDSGFRCMDFVACDEECKPICRLAGYSDVVHIEGIGGYGRPSTNGSLSSLLKWRPPDTIPVVAWQIDCLPRSGLLRIWPNATRKMKCGGSFSSFEIYSVQDNKDNERENDNDTKSQ